MSIQTVLKIKNSLKKNKLTNDSFWALFGNIIVKGLTLLAGIFIARFLGNDIYGEYGIVKSTLLSLAIFSTLGLGYTSNKYVAEFKISKPHYIPLVIKYSLNITFIVSSILSLILFLSADYVSSSILEAPHLSLPLKIVSSWLVFNALTTTQIGLLSGFGAFKGMARINSVMGSVTFFLSVLFTYLWGLNGALIALLITQVLNCLLNYRLIKLETIELEDFKTFGDKSFLKELLRLSLPLSLQEGIYAIVFFATTLLLIKFSTYGELGLYTAAMQWNAVIIFIPNILRNVVLSHFSKVNQDPLEHGRILKIILLFNFIVTIIPFVLIFVFSNYISHIYGSSFIGLSKLINIAVFTVIFLSLSNVYSQAYLSQDKNWTLLSLRLIRDLGIFISAYLYLSNGSGVLNGATLLVWCNLVWNLVFFILIVLVYEFKIKRSFLK